MRYGRICTSMLTSCGQKFKNLCATSSHLQVYWNYLLLSGNHSKVSSFSAENITAASTFYGILKFH